MKLGIMQPYFLPYIGYFQLIHAVDTFVVYDQIKYTKKGWINRNRMLQNGKDAMFSLPLEAASDHLDVCQRQISSTFSSDKFLAKIEGAYRQAPHFRQAFALIQTIVQFPDHNLFGFLHHSIRRICAHLEIKTPIVVSSQVPISPTLKGQDKVLALSEALKATTYINAIGGVELYSDSAFSERGVELRFIKSRPVEYPQFGMPFVPWLSILDVLMFNSVDTIQSSLLDSYDLIQHV